MEQAPLDVDMSEGSIAKPSLAGCKRRKEAIIVLTDSTNGSPEASGTPSPRKGLQPAEIAATYAAAAAAKAARDRNRVVEPPKKKVKGENAQPVPTKQGKQQRDAAAAEAEKAVSELHISNRNPQRQIDSFMALRPSSKNWV